MRFAPYATRISLPNYRIASDDSSNRDEKIRALLDFPWWCQYLVVCPLPWIETPIAVQIERDALEQMPEVVDPKAAALEHLEFMVQSFYKATGLALPEVVGNRV